MVLMPIVMVVDGLEITSNEFISGWSSIGVSVMTVSEPSCAVVT